MFATGERQFDWVPVPESSRSGKAAILRMAAPMPNPIAPERTGLSHSG
jgi:hypothetical protein